MLKTKALIFCSFITLLGSHANAADNTATQSRLENSLKNADKEYSAYKKAKREAWALEQLKQNCHNIQNSDYEQMFIRYMRKEHPVEAKTVIFNSSPAAAQRTQEYAKKFISQEVVPREKDFYLAHHRCPNLSDLPFPY